MSYRFAIYYAPGADDPLWEKAAHWFGRDAATGAVFSTEIPGVARDRLTALSVSANRYGFHATIKAPMALADGTSRESLSAALSDFATTAAPVSIGRLQLKLIDGFIALVPVEQSAALTQFAGEVVERFEPFRRPLSAADRDKRIGNGKLSSRQVALLDQFGYPYVFEQFQFHMTLTDRLVEADRAELMAAAMTWFGPLLGREVLLDRLVLFSEPQAGVPFDRVAEFPLSAKAEP